MEFQSEGKDLHQLIYFMPRQSKSKNLSLLSLLNKQTALKGQHNFCFTLYVADPATFLASNSALGTLFSYENS